MRKAAHVIGKELRKMIFPGIFFLIVFNFVLVTKYLLLDSFEIKTSGIAVAVISALIATKAVMIGEAIAITHLFKNRPLIFSVAWKTLIFWFFFILLRSLEELFHLYRDKGSFSAALKGFGDEVSWPLFWGIQMWLLVSLILFTSISGLERMFGDGAIKRAFLGDRTKDHPSDKPPVAGDSVGEISAPKDDLDFLEK